MKPLSEVEIERRFLAILSDAEKRGWGRSQALLVLAELLHKEGGKTLAAMGVDRETLGLEASTL